MGAVKGLRMKRMGCGLAWVSLLLLALLMAGCTAVPAQHGASDTAYEVVDARGDTVRFTKKPQRVMTFTSGADEIVLGLIPPERMIAVNEGFFEENRSNIFSLVQQVPNKIERNPAVESVAALKPDLVLVQTWIPIEKVYAMRDLGIPVVVCQTPKTIEEIRETIRLMATSLGEKDRGERLIAMMDRELAALRQRIAEVPAEKKGKTVAIVSIMPAYGGAGGLFDEVLHEAGALNAKGLVGNKNGQVMTKEQFVACNPDYIFLPKYYDSQSSEEVYGAEYLRDASVAGMKAIRENQVRYPWGRYIYNVSQNIVFAVQEAAWMMYGDEFSQPMNRHLSAAE